MSSEIFRRSSEIVMLARSALETLLKEGRKTEMYQPRGELKRAIALPEEKADLIVKALQEIKDRAIWNSYEGEGPRPDNLTMSEQILEESLPNESLDQAENLPDPHDLFEGKYEWYDEGSDRFYKTPFGDIQVAKTVRQITEEFIECDECAAKPGQPILCPECLARRDKLTGIKRGGTER